MSRRMTRGDVIRKCIVVIEGMRRAFSRGNAGLEAQKGYETEFGESDEMLQTLREMLREMEHGGAEPENVREWQAEIMQNGAPRRLTAL